MQESRVYPVDFVILWVDGSDPQWQAERQRYVPHTADGNSNIRFRDWNLLRYWFRGVEVCAPWVNRIHFVTCGHYPSWLNPRHPKLNLVKHSDFIDDKYLPLFNSSAIEVNINRIKGLSEHFVYFNDDMFALRPIKRESLFADGRPCDMLELDTLKPAPYYHIVLNDIIEINKHFNQRDLLKRHFGKVFNYRYGSKLLKNALLAPWPYFAGFKQHHLPTAYLKSTLNMVWDKCHDALAQTCSHRFRQYECCSASGSWHRDASRHATCTREVAVSWSTSKVCPPLWTQSAVLRST